MSTLKLANAATEKSETANQEDAVVEPTLDLSGQVPTFVELLPEQVKPYWRVLTEYPLLEALVILLLFFGLAYVIRRYAIRLIEKLTEKTKSNLDDDIIRDIRGPIFTTVLWLGVIVASKSAGLTQGVLFYITPIALSMIVLGLLRASLDVSGHVITALSRDPLRFKKLDIRTEPLLIITSKILLLIMAAYIVLLIWGINPVGLIASAGIVGIAVGFAAKDTLANLFSGVFILADRPYKLGDYVNLDSGERGKVTHIGIRSTRLLTRDDIEVTIPNGVIGNAKIVNESGGFAHKMRIRVNVSVAYESDLDKVEKVLMDVADAEQRICKYPAARVRFRNFADSGISVQLMGWIDEPELRGQTIHMLMKAIHRAFDQHRIEIPYPRFVSIIKQDQGPRGPIYSD